MGDTKIKGTMDRAKGKAKEMSGKVTGKRSDQAKGKAEQLKGRTKEKRGSSRFLRARYRTANCSGSAWRRRSFTRPTESPVMVYTALRIRASRRGATGPARASA
jgi:uncharacterized protein YjbJ (UPF0337 family)